MLSLPKRGMGRVERKVRLPPCSRGSKRRLSLINSIQKGFAPNVKLICKQFFVDTRGKTEKKGENVL